MIGAAIPIFGRLIGGSWPQLHTWVPVLALGVAGAQFGRPWRRPVSRQQLDDYRRWRAQTELIEDERNVHLSGKLGVSLDLADAPPPRMGRRVRATRSAVASSRGLMRSLKSKIGR